MLHIIRNEQEYQEALKRIETLMELDPEVGTEESDTLEVLALLVEKYEERYYPIALPDPIDAIKYKMEQEGLKQKDLIPILGSKSKVSEVLNRRVALSLNMISRLHESLHIPFEVLIPRSTSKHP